MCNCIPPVFCQECPPPVVATPCVNGEKCEEFNWVDCNIYRGPNLVHLDISTGDRLDKILEALDRDFTSAGIEVEDSDSVKLNGTGIASSKLQAEVIINPAVENLAIETSDGLLVKFTKANLLQMMTIIAADDDLKDAFCALVAGCYNTGSCGLVTDMTVNMG